MASSMSVFFPFLSFSCRLKTLIYTHLSENINEETLAVEKKQTTREAVVMDRSKSTTCAAYLSRINLQQLAR